MQEDLSHYNAPGTTLRRAQLRELDMLLEFDRICRRHQIAYWLDFGTLLGAVRHGGFIPWDDDMDVCIFGSDYERLRQALIDELPSRFCLQDVRTDRHVFVEYGRLRDRQSYCYYPKFVLQHEQGLWLDIFMVDRVPSLKLRNMADFFYRRAYREIHHYGEVTYHSKTKILLNKLMGYVLYPFASGLVRLVKWLGRRRRSSVLAGFASHQRAWCIEQELMPLQEISFEGHSFFAPHDTDAYLRRKYGDYMQIPPVGKRDIILDTSKIKFF